MLCFFFLSVFVADPPVHPRYRNDCPALVKDLKLLAEETGEKFNRLRTWLYNRRTRDKARAGGRSLTRAEGMPKTRIPAHVVALLEEVYVPRVDACTRVCVLCARVVSTCSHFDAWSSACAQLQAQPPQRHR